MKQYASVADSFTWSKNFWLYLLLTFYLYFYQFFFSYFYQNSIIRNHLQIFNLLVEPNNELIDQHSIRFDSITSFARYKGYIIYQISFSELSVVLPAFTCARAIGNLLRFSLELIILIPLPSDCFSIWNILLLRQLGYFFFL